MAPSFDLLFTDLDGTLLDPRHYGWAEARPALRRLRALGIPVVLCTSKTAAEALPLARRLSPLAPCIVENGGAVYIPPGFQMLVRARPFHRGGWVRIPLGVPYPRLVAGLHALRTRTGLRLRGFSDMGVQEVARRCGLSLADARRAKRRGHDEPFLLEVADPGAWEELERIAADLDLRIVRGGRFRHLTGPADKGSAARWVLTHLGGPQRRSVGLGDSANDLPMLRTVDQPVLVPGPEGRCDEEVAAALPHALKAEGSGPRGWNQAVLALTGEDSGPGVRSAWEA